MSTPLPVEQRAQGGLFIYTRLMNKVPYAKPFLSYQEQLQQLKDRGLTIEDEAKALHLLESISYYRLSGYWYPMLEEPKSNHAFKEGSTFDNAFKLYCFDRELRKLIAAELEKIEVAIRAKMIHILSETDGPYWFLDPTIFKDTLKHGKTVLKFDEDFAKSDEQFIKAFKAKYSNSLPPCWIMLEISSFGNLSHVYKNLKKSRQKRAIANYFGLDENTFQSWLHSIVYVRNVCAHHTRLWNRVMSITPRIPLNPSNTFLDTSDISRIVNNKPFFLLSMIVYLLDIVNPNHTFKARFAALLNKYPNVDIKAMGAADNWHEEELWK